MAMTDLKAAFEIMEAHPDFMDFEGPKPQSLIEAAEALVGFTFPPTYQRFVAEYGAGNFGARELYGIIKADFDSSGVPDAVWCTLGDLNRGVLPKGLLEIYNLGDGGLYCLDLTVTDAEGECPVVEFYPGAPLTGQPKLPVKPDFGSLLLNLVQEELTR